MTRGRWVMSLTTTSSNMMAGGREAESCTAAEHAHLCHGDGADPLADSDRSCHHDVHGRDGARDAGGERCGSFEPRVAPAGGQVAGEISAGLFALGIVSLGMLANPAMAGSASYALSEA
jgi:hypothetical protein